MTAKPHTIEESRSPVRYIVRCSCGWSHSETRRQNAWARAAKMRAAINSHAKTVEAQAKQ